MLSIIVSIAKLTNHLVTELSIFNELSEKLACGDLWIVTKFDFKNLKIIT